MTGAELKKLVMQLCVDNGFKMRGYEGEGGNWVIFEHKDFNYLKPNEEHYTEINETEWAEIYYEKEALT